MATAFHRQPFPTSCVTVKQMLIGIAAVLLFVCGLYQTELRACHADYYWKLGHYYKELGWTEKSRAALKQAVVIAPSSPAGHKASLYLNARIPVAPIGAEAEQANITAYNLNYYGRSDEAIVEFKKVIAAYPNFEWPYCNLSGIYIDRGRYEEARALLDKALAINPNYANAWRNLAQVNAYEGKQAEATKCRQKFEELLPVDIR